MKKNTALSEQFQTFNRIIVERGKIDIPSIQRHDRSGSWFGTGIFKKSGGAKLVLWSKTRNKEN